MNPKRFSGLTRWAIPVVGILVVGLLVLSAVVMSNAPIDTSVSSSAQSVGLPPAADLGQAASPQTNETPSVNVPDTAAAAPADSQDADAALSSGDPDRLAGALPVPGEEENESQALGELEQAWNDRLTYPTGVFNPAWVRAAAQQNTLIPAGVPAGRQSARPNGVLSLNPSGFTALGPMPEHMTGCTGCYDYGLTAGRINAIVVDPTTTTNGSIVAYSGGVGGGVWKTTNCCSDSTVWTAVTDDPLLATISIDALAMDPQNHNTIYAGTGDLNYGSFSMGSQGILKSTDAGATWTLVGTDVFTMPLPEPAGEFPQYNAVGKVSVDPRNSNNIVAGTKTGLYLSYDGGTTWTGPCLTNSYTTMRQDITGLELTGAVTETRIIAAVGVRGFATAVQYNLGQNGANGLYRGTIPASGCPTDFTLISRNDNGFNFGTAVTGSPYTTTANMNAGSGDVYSNTTTGNQLGRIDIAVAPSDPNYIYAQVQSIAANSNGGCGNTSGCQLGIWASTDGGDTWSFMEGSAGGSLRSCTNGQGDYPQNWYDQGLAVDPNNPDRLFADTFEVWFADRTQPGFYNLTCGYNGGSLSNHVVHVDQHALAFVPSSSDILLAGNDGGAHGAITVSQVLSGTRPAWFNMDGGYNTIEFYSGDISGDFANSPNPVAVGGAQDNGPSSVMFSGSPTGPAQWQMGLGGDGFYARLDPVGGPTAAQGTITLANSPAPTAGQTFTVSTQMFTWVTTRTVTGEVSIGANRTARNANIVAAVNTDISDTVTAASSGSSRVIVSANSTGPAGNSIVFLPGDSDGLTMDGAGFLGGTTQGITLSIRLFEGNNSGGMSRCLVNCTDPGSSWSSVRGGWNGDTQAFQLPFDIFHGGIPGGDDCAPAGLPGGCGHLIAGTTRVWETIAGGDPTMNSASWYITNFTNTQNMSKQILGNRSYINQVKYSPKYSSVAMAGTNDANVWIGFNLGTGVANEANWVDVTGGNTVLPNRPVLGIALDPTVPKVDLPVGYAAVGGFDENTPTMPGHVFQVTCETSYCATFTWVDKSGNLPNIPVDSIIVNPNYPPQVYAGTDWGLYFTDDITAASPIWQRFDTGLPHAMIWDMQIDRGATALSVWTRGRGAYVYPLPTGFPAPIADVTLGNLSQTYDGTPKSATVHTSPPGLSVTLAYNGSPTPPTNAGAYTVTATVDDSIYQGIVTNTLTIALADTTTSLSSAPNPALAGQAVTFTAVVTSAASTPTGTVQLYADGALFGDPITLSSGSAMLITDTLPVGTHVITGTYSGTANYVVSEGLLAGGQVVDPYRLYMPVIRR